MPHKTPKPQPSRWEAANSKLKTYVKRYGLAELIGTVTAIGGAFIGDYVSDSEVIQAYAGAIGENAGYYGVLIPKKIKTDRQAAEAANTSYGFRGGLRTTRDLLWEFGPAEILDSLFVRPLTMGVGARTLGRDAGVIAGKVAADVLFYVPTIIGYETRKHFNSKHK